MMAGFPVAFTLAGVALIFAGIGVLTGTFDPSFLEAFPNRIYGIMTNETLIAVPVFVFMGVMLERSKLADQLLQSLAQIMRRIPGGLGIAVMIVGTLMAASRMRTMDGGMICPSVPAAQIVPVAISGL